MTTVEMEIGKILYKFELEVQEYDRSTKLYSDLLADKKKATAALLALIKKRDEELERKLHKIATEMCDDEKKKADYKYAYRDGIETAISIIRAQTGK